MNSQRMLEQFEFGLKSQADKAYYFVFQANRLLWPCQGSRLTPLSEQEWFGLGLQHEPPQNFGAWNGVPCYALEAAQQAAVPKGYEWLGMRQLLRLDDELVFALAGRGKQLLDFIRNHQYCGCCGAPTSAHAQELARLCDSCSQAYYPRISPCIIVLVTRGEELLLARGAHHAEGVYSTIAGFVEPGETLEHAVRREVMEEVGVKISQLEYIGSQSWPFPNQLMLGFLARHQGGEINVDGREIVDAGWWHYRDLPSYPSPGAMSATLIGRYIERIEEGREANKAVNGKEDESAK